MSLEIRKSRLEDAPSFSDAVISVASEQWFLATVDGFDPEQTKAYIQRALTGGIYQVVGISDGKVIGACDIRRGESKGFSHVGQLGMFLREEWRGQGIGRRLLTACLALAREGGLEKVELEVFTDNLPAIRLYESSGFRHEGRKVRGRKWGGRYQDVALMAIWLDAEVKRRGGLPP